MDGGELWWFVVAPCGALSCIFVPTHGGTTRMYLSYQYTPHPPNALGAPTVTPQLFVVESDATVFFIIRGLQSF